MAIRFSKPVESQYVDQYVPLPLEFLQGVAERKQGQFDQAKAQLAGFDDILKVNYIDNPAFGPEFTNKAVRDQLVQSYQQRTEPLYNRLYTQGDYAGTALELNRLARQFQEDPTRLELEESYKNYQQFLPEYQKTKADPTKFYPGYWKEPLSWKGTQEGQLNPFRFAGAKSKEDYVPPAMKLMDQIASSGSKNAYYSFNPDGSINKKKSGWEGVLRADIDRVAKANVETLLSGNSGQFLIDESMDMYNYGVSQGLINPDEISPEAYIRNRAESILKSVAEKQLFKKTESGSDIEFPAEWWYNQQQESKKDPITRNISTEKFKGYQSNVPGVNSLAVYQEKFPVDLNSEDGFRVREVWTKQQLGIPLTQEELDLMNKYEVQSTPDREIKSLPGMPEMSTTIPGEFKISRKGNIIGWNEAEQKNWDILKENSPEWVGKESALKEAFDTAIQQGKFTVAKAIPLSGDTGEYLAQAFSGKQGNLLSLTQGRPVRIYDSNGKVYAEFNDFAKAQEWAKSHGKGDTKVDFTDVIIGGDRPGAVFYGGIKDKDGKQFTIEVQASKEEQQAYSTAVNFIQEVNAISGPNAFRKEIPIPGIGSVVMNKGVSKDGNITENFTFYDANGRPQIDSQGNPVVLGRDQVFNTILKYNVNPQLETLRYTSVVPEKQKESVSR